MTDIPKKPDIYMGWFEPSSPASKDTPPKYRYNHTIETPRGHSLELDDTPGRERVRISHRAKTFIEIHPDGSEVHKVYGNGYEIMMQDKNVVIKGVCNVTIEGDCNMRVIGDKIETVEGNYELHVNGHHTIVADKTCSISSQNDLSIGGGANLTGTVRIHAGDALVLAGDLAVKGEITGRKITSLTRVDALTGISAGPLGFVTQFGGIQVGPGLAAIPGVINCDGTINAIGPITSEASVIGATGLFGTMNAGLMHDTVNVLAYNGHTHAGVGGPVSLPMI